MKWSIDEKATNDKHFSIKNENSSLIIRVVANDGMEMLNLWSNLLGRDHYTIGIYLICSDQMRSRLFAAKNSQENLMVYFDKNAESFGILSPNECLFHINKNKAWYVINQMIGFLESLDNDKNSLNILRDFIKDLVPIKQPSSLVSQSLFKVQKEVDANNSSIKDNIKYLPEELKEKIILKR